ncbi:MAG TPA: phosphoribosylformylglycinamidine synthase subunit PurQ, partial [Aquificae bacterium]|nr:phosphoribosylformylglycinamidine synthase subunit PurQ [Aquificota bacterium]
MAKISPVSLALIEEAQKNKYILGICNGFQILTELKLLPGALIPNKSLRFICKFVDLKVINKNTPFTWKVEKEILKIPIAHFQGNYYIDEKTLQVLKENNQIVLKYIDNPNGSIEDIAGIINENQNIFALMPHPERASEHILGSEDGRYLFESVIESIRKG